MIEFSAELPPFVPHPLFRGGHLQTIGSSILRPPIDPQTSICHIIELRDGDQMAVIDDEFKGWEPGQRIVVAVHGLTGSHRSQYMIRLRNQLSRQRLRMLRIDLRGFGDSSLISRGHSNAGSVEEIVDTIEWANDTFGESPMTLVGYSLGANIILQYLGRNPDKLPKNVDSAMVVAPPIDLLKCAWNLRKGLNRFYDKSFIRSLHAQLHMRRRKVPGLVDLEIKPLPDRLLQFDDQFTALACGYCGAKEYYERCSSAPLLKNIEIPTRILVAEDDPVVPIEMFEQWSMSNSVEVIRTTSGGHLGYIDRKIDRHSRWLDRCLASWVSDLSRPAANGFDCDSKDIEGAPIESV